MRRVVGLAVALAIGCAGCSGAARESPTESHTRTPDLAWQPVDDADPGIEVTPAPMGPRTDLEAAVAARSGDRDRVSGEMFALQVAQVLKDGRHRTPGAWVVGRIASGDLPDDVRRYLIRDIDMMRASGLQRHLDASAGSWIRSRVVGPETAPVRLEVEIAAVIASAPMKFHAWYRARYDVAWGQGRWSLVGFSDGLFGPETAPLTPAERREFLPGPGWRYVPPA